MHWKKLYCIQGEPSLELGQWHKVDCIEDTTLYVGKEIVFAKVPNKQWVGS